jgi:hypothetical protein
VFTILARKPRSSDTEYVLVDRGEGTQTRYCVGTANAHSLANGEWFWGHYFKTLDEARNYFHDVTTPPPAAYPGMKLHQIRFTLYIRPEIPEEVLEQICDDTDWTTLEEALKNLIQDFIEDNPSLKDNRVTVETE